MLNVFIVEGKGQFTDNEGKTVIYPIRKLVVSQKQTQVEIKIDKINWKLLTMCFDLFKDGSKYEDEYGNELDIIYFDEKQDVAVELPKKITVE